MLPLWQQRFQWAPHKFAMSKAAPPAASYPEIVRYTAHLYSSLVVPACDLESHALDLEGIANAKVPEADVLHAVATHTGTTFAELGDVNGAARRGHPGRHPAVAEQREVEHRPGGVQLAPGEGDQKDGGQPERAKDDGVV